MAETWKSELARLIESLGTNVGRLDNKPVTFRNLDELAFQLRKELPALDAKPTDDDVRGIMQESAARAVEIDRLRMTLEEIAGGTFPDASTLALAGDWKAMYRSLQKLAQAALNK